VSGVQLASIINSAVVIVTPDNLEVQAVGWLWSANPISSLFEDSLLRNPSYVLYSPLTLFFELEVIRLLAWLLLLLNQYLSTRIFCFRKSSITETWSSVEPVVRPCALIEQAEENVPHRILINPHPHFISFQTGIDTNRVWYPV